MRFWIYLAVFIVLAVVAVVFAQIYLGDFVYIRYQQWEISPPIAVALGVLVLAMLALYILVRLLLFIVLLPGWVAKVGKRHRQKKQQQLMNDAIRLSVYHDRRELLKVLAELASSDTAVAWWAAKVAGELGNQKVRNQWLQKAAVGDDKTIAAVAKAHLCQYDNRLTEADNILRAAGAPRGPTLLAEAFYNVSREREDWVSALAATMALRESAPIQWRSTVFEVIGRQLKQAKSAAEATSFWKDKVSSDDRKRPALLAAYLSSLCRLGDEKGTKDGLTQALKQHSQSNEIIEVVIAFGDKTLCETAFKANESRSAGNDVAALKLLAELAEQLDLPGKARRYYQMLNVLEPHPRYQNALAALPEQTPDP